MAGGQWWKRLPSLWEWVERPHQAHVTKIIKVL